MSKLSCLAFLLVTGCVASVPMMTSDPDPGSDDPGMDLPPDDSPMDALTPTDDGYIPKPFTATRFGVFYQLSDDVIDIYQDPQQGLPHVADHAWIITHSHAVAFASRTFADKIHERDDFYYAPAFDVWDASHAGWETASDATLALWAHQFRDVAISAHADMFTFNESPSNTGTTDSVRVHIAKLLRYLHEPDAQGRQLWGVVYLTEAAAMVNNYDSPAPDFFAAIDETSVALVAEHYHSTGFVCAQSEAALASHYFNFRTWLAATGDPAKLSIANSKYTILHSARFDSGPSGWAGGNSDTTSLADYQRALSRISMVTRDTEGGYNRLSFGPVTSSLTEIGVQPRITELFRWHYDSSAPQAGETACVDNFAGNCNCD